MRVFEAGSTIVEAGDVAGDLYVVQTGVAFMIDIKVCAWHCDVCVRV